jgi:transposase InsO family protein
MVLTSSNVKLKIRRRYKQFAMRHPDEMVQVCIWISLALSIGVILVKGIIYIVSCLDDCSRKVASRWCERKRSVDVLNVLEDWIMINGKPEKVMHDNDKQFTSRIFRHFLVHNHIKDR